MNVEWCTSNDLVLCKADGACNAHKGAKQQQCAIITYKAPPGGLFMKLCLHKYREKTGDDFMWLYWSYTMWLNVPNPTPPHTAASNLSRNLPPPFFLLHHHPFHHFITQLANHNARPSLASNCMLSVSIWQRLDEDEDSYGEYFNSTLIIFLSLHLVSPLM